MSPRKRIGSRVYARKRGSTARYYGNFRDFADVGGKREPLVPRNAKRATTDPDVAAKLAADRVAELTEKRNRAAITGTDPLEEDREAERAEERQLGRYAAYHLVEKARAGKVTDGELERIEVRLMRAVEYFGVDRDIATISVKDVQQWAGALSMRKGQGGRTFSGQTVRHHLNALSNLYRRAGGDGHVAPGLNPVAAMMDKPTPAAGEARWLEVHDAALLLEAARLHKATREDAIPFLHALLATFLLTGGRQAEVLGLEVEDVSFDRRVITFRPNDWRRLKTRTSHRTVPLWPQLEEILREHVYGGEQPRVSGLLFPSARAGAAMITDLRKAIDAIAERAGWKASEVRTKVFRHTYCAARLQTTDRGAPVSVYTVGRELGHGGEALVKRVYGHLGQVRHRAEVMEYHVDQQLARLEADVQEIATDRRRKSEAAQLQATLDGYRSRLEGLGKGGVCHHQ